MIVLNPFQDIRFFDMVKAIRNDEVNYAYTIDRRTVQKLLSKLECEGKILIVNEKIFLEEEQSYNGTFYTTIDCTNETFQAHVNQYRTRKEIDNLLSRKSDRKPLEKTKLAEFDIPKFQRLKAVHLYFWYLAYGHECNPCERQPGNKPVIYNKANDWRTFVPPFEPPR